MPRWLTHNWELKLLALLLAAIVWFFVVSADRSQLGVAAPVEYVGLDGTHVVLGTPRETVDVQVEAARWAAARLAPASLRVRVDVSRLGEGEHLVQIGPQQVEAPAGVHVLRVSPAAVRLTLARAAVKEVRVVPQVVGSPAAAHTISRIAVEPQIVEVRGPRTTIEEHTTVETAPVDVTGGRQTITRTVGLLLPDSVYTTTQRTVQVTVEIRAEDPMRPRQSGGPR